MSYVLSEPYATLYEEYLEYEKSRVTEQGFESLKGRTRRFLKWLEENDLLPEEVKVMDAIQYKKEVGERKTKEGSEISVGTIQNYLKASRSFFDYLVLTERIKTNPFKAVKNPRVPEHISRNVLTESQMNRLLEEFSRYYEIENREKALRRYRCHVLCEFLYSTGMRIAEAGSLIESNLDLERRFVYIPEGKGRVPRTAFLTGYAADVMKEYLKIGISLVMGTYQRPNSELLFGAIKARIGSVLNEELKEVCKKLELPVITSHGFRHSLGTHLLKNGCDMRYIQVILGHERLGTTQIYTKVEKDDLRNSIDAYHPRKYRTLEKEKENAGRTDNGNSKDSC